MISFLKIFTLITAGLAVLAAPDSCTLNCSNLPNCVQCVSRTRLTTGDQNITISVSDCKGSSLSWVCCRGAIIEGNYDPTACVASDCDGELDGNKCDEMTTMDLIVPQNASRVFLQIHDGRISGDISCQGAACCGGSGTSCRGTTSGVCNTILDLATCPTNGGIRGGFNRECFADSDCDELYMSSTCSYLTCDQDEGMCVENPKSSGTMCRESVGDCDITEVCDGESFYCPDDTVEGTDVVCRSAAGVCDIEETCDGENVDCPSDIVESDNTVCRVAAGACDVEETCDGDSVDCPSDQVQATGTTCRPNADECDVLEVCNGTAVDCPDDIRRDFGHSYKCGRNCYVCSVQSRYILSSTKTTSISTCNLGACASVEYLPWPQCMNQCVESICPNSKALSNAEFFTCIPSIGSWKCNKKVDANANTTYPICA